MKKINLGNLYHQYPTLQAHFKEWFEGVRTNGDLGETELLLCWDILDAITEGNATILVEEGREEVQKECILNGDFRVDEGSFLKDMEEYKTFINALPDAKIG